MKLELGKTSIKDTRLDDRTHVKNGALYVSEEEVERFVLEDDKLTGCHVDIVKPGGSVRITPAGDVIEPRVKVSSRETFPSMIGKIDPQMGTGKTHALEGCYVVTVGKIVGFQGDVIDMSGPAAGYCPFSQTYNLCAVVEPADGLEIHVYEKAARMAGLKVVAYVGKAARELEPDEIITYEAKPIFEQAAIYPDLPKVSYIRILQSQSLLHDTYYYGADAKQFIPTFMHPTEIMDGAIVSGNCIAPCDKIITYHHFHNPVIEDCYRHRDKGINFMGAILTNENVFLADKEHHSDTVAKLCNWMRLGSVLITKEGCGNPNADLMMNYRKVERAGAKVVLITDEFLGEDGKSQSLTDVRKEVDALTSCGQGSTTLQFPAMDKVIGAQDSIEMQTGGWDGCKNPDGSFEAELQIIIVSTIANGSNELVARDY